MQQRCQPPSGGYILHRREKKVALYTDFLYKLTLALFDTRVCVPGCETLTIGLRNRANLSQYCIDWKLRTYLHQSLSISLPLSLSVPPTRLTSETKTSGECSSPFRRVLSQYWLKFDDSTSMARTFRRVLRIRQPDASIESPTIAPWL